MTFWKRRNHGDSKKISKRSVKKSVWKVGWDEKSEHRGSSRQWNTLSDTILMDTCQYTFVQTYIMVHNVNYGLWVVIMPHCRFINHNKQIPLWWGMLIMGEAMRMWGKFVIYGKSLNLPPVFPSVLLWT